MIGNKNTGLKGRKYEKDLVCDVVCTYGGNGVSGAV
jgi:hypothetical protein